MVLILSNDFEVNTCDVIDWLLKYKTDFVRINVDDVDLESLSIKIDNDLSAKNEFILNYKGREINSKDIKSYWFRRGTIPNIQGSSEKPTVFNSNAYNNKLKKYLELEYKVLIEYIHDLLDDVPVRLGSRGTANLNKLKVLKLAKEIGLSIPDTIVTTSSNDIRKAKEACGEIITKSIDNLFMAEKVGQRMLFYTEEVSDSIIDDLPENIFPSLIQKKLNKKYELRIFYLDGDFYSMAIFSQLDDTTTVDFRNYNTQKPNRTVPFKLPEHIETKLHILMQKLQLKTGSIDIVVTTDNEYVFLEINPVGQFAQVAGPCNYPLFHKIAEYLTKYEN